MEHLKASPSPIPYSGEGWFDPLEEAVRFQVRAFIEAMVEAELQAALGGAPTVPLERRNEIFGISEPHIRDSLVSRDHGADAQWP